MPKNTSSQKSDKPDANITAARIGIIAAILTLVGTVATAVFGYLSIRAPLELSIQTTQTAEARTLTLSPITKPSTNLPQSPATSQTFPPTSAPPLSITQTSPTKQTSDFSQDCIDDKSWTPYVTEVTLKPATKNNCWQMLNIGLVASSGSLLISQQVTRPVGVYGIVTNVPETSIVEFDIKVENMSNALFKAGIISGTSPDKKLEGVLLSMEDDGFLHIVRLENNKELTLITYDIKCFPGTYHFKFEINKAKLITSRSSGKCKDGTDAGFANYLPVDIYFESRNFFVGYETISSNSRIGAEITKLSISTK